ncbi:MAG: MYG1 family protein [Oscillospiraceae bacterium]
MDFSGNPANLPELAFTHGGRFHADDVFSAALLQLLRPDIRIHRGYTVPKGFSGIVFDIGNGPFDHHAKGSPRRPNGTPYAAFGLLWRAYGHHFLPEEAAASFDEKFIQPLDIDDNNGTGHVLAVLIGSFNPTWDSDRDENDAFFEAVAVAKQLLHHRLDSLAALLRGRPIVEAALAKMTDGIVTLESFVPWKPILIPSTAEFVILPSPRGGYSVQCVPKDNRGTNKVPFPPAWRGQPPEALRRLTGVADITFCHASGFMCSVGSVAGARALAQTAQAAAAQDAAGHAGASGAAQAAKNPAGPAAASLLEKP